MIYNFHGKYFFDYSHYPRDKFASLALSGKSGECLLDSQFFHHFLRTSIGSFQIIGDPRADLFVAVAGSGHNGATMLPHRAVKP